MSRYRLGCSGWAYDDWVGPFYPPGTAPGEFLERYARVFSTVEVDSTFYRTPSLSLTRRWAERTPAGFSFSLKVPRDVTHGAEPAAGRVALAGFLRAIEPLRTAGKLGPIVLQFPPSFRAPGGRAYLEQLLADVPREYALAVELRHRSWWAPTTESALRARAAALVWSVLPGTEPPAWATAEFVYARFVGDRALTKFDRIQRDARPRLEQMRRLFESAGQTAATIWAYVNNHFMGFGPGSVEQLAAVLGEPPPELRAALTGPGQRTLALDDDAA